MTSRPAKVLHPRLRFVAVAIFAATTLAASAALILRQGIELQDASARPTFANPTSAVKIIALHRCVYGYEDNCFATGKDGKPLRLLSEADISDIKRNPDEIISLYQSKYRERLSHAINKNLALTDAAISAIFVSLVAYESMPYQGFQGGLTPITKFNTAKDYLQNGIGLTCVSYVDLAIRLYSILWPKWPVDVQFIPTGWRQDSPVGNHVELIATGKGLGASDLLLDPTFGVYATGEHIGQYGVLAGIPLELGQQLALRANQGPGQIMSTGASNVERALSNGLFRPKDMIYSYIARPDKTYNAPTDFVASIRPGPAHNFYYQNTGNEVWITNATGLRKGSRSVYEKQLAAETRNRFTRTFVSRPDESPPHREPTASLRIIRLAGLGNSSTLYLLTSGNRVLQIGNHKQSSDSNKLTVSSVFSYDGKIYELTRGLFIEKTYRDVIALYDARGAHAGKAVFMLKGNGTLTYADPSINFGNEIELDTNISDVLVAVSGGSATVLKSDGSVQRLNTYSLYLSPPDVVAETPAWQPSREPNRFVSIRMTHSEQIITATRPDGSSAMTNAAIY